MSTGGSRHRFTASIVKFFSGIDWTRRFLLVALLGLSWWSTTQGLLGLITAANGQPNPAGVIVIGIAVAILTILISWTLERLRGGTTGLLAPLFLCGYVLLTVISVGFGYGFYWTHIESHNAAQRSAEAETERLSQHFALVYRRLDESLSALDAVATMSVARADQEAATGGTCGAGGLAGPGPRYKLRTEDAQTMTALRERIASQVGQDGTATRGSLYSLRAQLNEQLELLTPKSFAALDEDSALKTLRGAELSMREIATQYEGFRTGPSVQSAVGLLEQRIAMGQGVITIDGIAFTCPDPGLEIVMSQATAALTTLPPVPEVKLSVPLGAEATVAAFGKLMNTGLQPFVPGRKLEVMTGRDYIPLGVAVAVDLFILLLSLHGPAARSAANGGFSNDLLQGPEVIRHLMGGDNEADRPAYEEMLKHTFWWRGAYHLALPAPRHDESPTGNTQYKLSLAAMVLSDAGLLTPLSPDYGGGQWREHFVLHREHGEPGLGQSKYHLYRYENNCLARITSSLIRESVHSTWTGHAHGTSGDKSSAVRVEEPPKPAVQQRLAGLKGRTPWMTRQNTGRGMMKK